MRRVAITGLGVVSPVGVGQDAFWQGLLRPQTTGERRVHDFDPTLAYEDPKAIRRADRFEQFAMASAREALAQAGTLTASPERTGVLVGTGIGGADVHEEQTKVLIEKGSRRVSPFTVPMMMANAAAAAISIRWGFQGPCETVATACATGTHAIGQATRWIQWGICDAVIAGASEAAMTEVSIASFANMKALSASGRSRPFDSARDGFVIAEGSGIFVLEEWEAAKARGATILGEVLGSASLADGHHITAPAPGGIGAYRCMRRALEDARLTPRDIAHINAHGTSTALNDEGEALGIAQLFGTPGPVVTSIKGVTGHSLGAAGAIEAVSVVLSMRHRLIPPTDGLENFDPELPKIDVVMGGPREWKPGPALSNSFGFGGHNGTLVIAPA
ncbi:MAG: beta-ketoacyl-[acyl-carrier-protein] synthase family protein [Deltaproteobacteria bacterium]|nr:beta-ketoacyl-[acyl-carrier-protein] synthase family protein [Deltaproteobacteria bacterium]